MRMLTTRNPDQSGQPGLDPSDGLATPSGGLLATTPSGGGNPRWSAFRSRLSGPGSARLPGPQLSGGKWSAGFRAWAAGGGVRGLGRIDSVTGGRRMAVDVNLRQ